MTEKELIRQLKNLRSSEKAGALSGERADFMHKNLMARIDKDLEADGVKSYGVFGGAKLIANAFFPKFQFGAAFRYAVTMCVVLIFGVTGCLTAVSASFNSLPGDTLYTIKLATERVQLALAQDEAMKINLRTEFVGKRIEEMKQIIESPVSDKETRLNQAVSGLKTEINNVGDSLRNIENPLVATGTAKFIDEKMDELNQIVVHNSLQLPESVKNVSKEISGIMVEKGMLILNNQDNLPKQEQGNESSTSSPSILIPNNAVEIPDAPKKIQWQIIIEE